MAEREEYQSTHTGPEIDAAIDLVVKIEANPNENAEERLTKINIGNTIYSIPSGSGGGSSVTIRTWTVE